MMVEDSLNVSCSLVRVAKISVVCSTMKMAWAFNTCIFFPLGVLLGPEQPWKTVVRWI